MADWLGVSRATVSNWTSGRIVPSLQSRRLWAQKTGVPFEWLETGKTPEQVSAEGPSESFLSESNRRPFHYE